MYEIRLHSGLSAANVGIQLSRTFCDNALSLSEVLQRRDFGGECVNNKLTERSQGNGECLERLVLLSW